MTKEVGFATEQWELLRDISMQLIPGHVRIPTEYNPVFSVKLLLSLACKLCDYVDRGRVLGASHTSLINVLEDHWQGQEILDGVEP